MCQFYILIYSSPQIRSLTYHIIGNKTQRLLTNFDAGVNGIPYDFTFMCTTCNQSF